MDVPGKPENDCRPVGQDGLCTGSCIRSDGLAAVRGIPDPRRSQKGSESRVMDPARQRTLIATSTDNEWYTPAAYIESARRVLGGIDLDPASCEEANKTVRASRYYSIADDGLAQPWKGRIWLNPPYGGMVHKFARKLIAEHEAGNVETAILLVNAHCTDSKWFHPYWDHTLCFSYSRLDFDVSGREKVRNRSAHGSAFIYLGPEIELFRQEFSPFGAVVRRVQPVQFDLAA